MKKKANSPVVRVVQFRAPLKNLSDCDAAPYLRFFLVRNEEVAGSIPVSSTKLLWTYIIFRNRVLLVLPANERVGKSKRLQQHTLARECLVAYKDIRLPVAQESDN